MPLTVGVAYFLMKIYKFGWGI